MHVQDAPVPTRPATHGRAMPDAMLVRRLDPVVIGLPKYIAETLHVAKCHGKAQTWSEPQIARIKVVHHLLATAEFSRRRIQNDRWIETVLQYIYFPQVKRVVAWMHGLLHLSRLSLDLRGRHIRPTCSGSNEPYRPGVASVFPSAGFAPMNLELDELYREFLLLRGGAGKPQEHSLPG